MRRFSFHIGTLVILVLVLGVGFAALRESNDTWDSSIFSITLGALLLSILLAIHRTEKRRAFWLGFALFGTAYLALTLVRSVEPRLITTKTLAYLESKVPGRSVTSIVVSSLRIRGTASGAFGNDIQNLKLAADGNQVVGLWDATTSKLLGGWSGTSENFIRIGHSLFVLLVGWIGGQLSRHLSRSSRPAENLTTVDVDGTIS
jgi:hypothetical protein